MTFYSYFIHNFNFSNIPEAKSDLHICETVTIYSWRHNFSKDGCSGYWDLFYSRFFGNSVGSQTTHQTVRVRETKSHLTSWKFKLQWHMTTLLKRSLFLKFCPLSPRQPNSGTDTHNINFWDNSSGWSRGLCQSICDMKCSAMIWRSWVWTIVFLNLGRLVFLSKAYLNQKQVPIHANALENKCSYLWFLTVKLRLPKSTTYQSLRIQIMKL